MKATLVHVETGVEYYKNDNLFTPSADEKLLWSLFGMPKNIQKLEETFETDIDVFTGYTKREIETRVNDNFKNGNYNFLPAAGSLELRY